MRVLRKGDTTAEGASSGGRLCSHAGKAAGQVAASLSHSGAEVRWFVFLVVFFTYGGQKVRTRVVVSTKCREPRGGRRLGGGPSLSLSGRPADPGPREKRSACMHRMSASIILSDHRISAALCGPCWGTGWVQGRKEATVQLAARSCTPSGVGYEHRSSASHQGNC